MAAQLRVSQAFGVQAIWSSRLTTCDSPSGSDLASFQTFSARLCQIPAFPQANLLFSPFSTWDPKCFTPVCIPHIPLLCCTFLPGVWYSQGSLSLLWAWVALGGFGWLWISLLSLEPFEDSFILGGKTIPQAFLLPGQWVPKDFSPL